MPTLIVESDGSLTIPPEIIQKRGLRPGDELALVESPDGLLVYQGGVDQRTLEWWTALTDAERLDVATEARHYQSLSEEEQERLWSDIGEPGSSDPRGDELDPSSR